MLAVGSQSRLSGRVSLPVQSEQELNYKTLPELLKMRVQALATCRDLLANSYRPDKAVFGLVEGEKPWWGLYGQCLWGAGNSAIDGPSEESIYYLNPYMLIAPEAHNIGIWNLKALKPEEFQRRDFPFYWKAESLVYEPKACRAEATYNISAFDQKMNAHRAALKYPVNIRQFGLIAYNARDFGYNYLYAPLPGSLNFAKRYNTDQPVTIAQMLHCGGSCGYPGGCNNMSPSMPEIDQMMLTRLPAKVVIHLWKQRPPSVNSAPDFIYTMNFK